MELLQNPIIIGILSALGGAVIAWFFFLFEKIKFRRELKKLRESLANQMEITAEGNKSLKDNLEKMKVENENLRVSVQSWQQKPDRKEIRMLYVYDKAVAKLIEEAPGFGPLWVKALRDAEEEFAKSERGILAFTKNLLGLRSSKNLNSYVAEDVEIENPNNDNENVESNNINSSQKPL